MFMHRLGNWRNMSFSLHKFTWWIVIDISAFYSREQIFGMKTFKWKHGETKYWLIQNFIGGRGSESGFLLADGGIGWGIRLFIDWYRVGRRGSWIRVFYFPNTATHATELLQLISRWIKFQQRMKYSFISKHKIPYQTKQEIVSIFVSCEFGEAIILGRALMTLNASQKWNRSVRKYILNITN